MNWFFWAVLASLIWGFVPLLEKVGLFKIEPVAGLFYRCLGVVIGLVFLGVFFVRPQQIKSVDLRSAVFLILGGLLASVVAQICFYNSLKTGDISRVVPIAGSYPLISFLIGILVLSEGFSLMKFLGAGLIIIGIWVLKV